VDVAVDQTTGAVAVTGSSWGDAAAGWDDYLTILYNGATGQQEWTARFNGPPGDRDYPAAVAFDPAGDVVVTGSSWGSAAAGWDDYATLKYDAATGAVVWSARYNGPAVDRDGATALGIAADGTVYVAGFSWRSGTAADYATIKYTSTGAPEWEGRYNGPIYGLDGALALALDADRVYVTGGSDGVGYSDFATVAYPQVLTPLSVPNAPGGLTATAVDPGRADLEWADAAAEEEYRVERAREGGGFGLLARVGSDTTVYTDSGLVPNTRYRYRVRAWNEVGESPPSPEAEIVTPRRTGGRLSAPRSFNVGKAAAGGEASRTLRLRNTDSREPLRLTLDAPTGPFSNDGPTSLVVPPRSSVGVALSFSPQSPGKASGTLAIHSSEIRRPTVTVRLSGVGR
jgi:hypothetical protein